MNKILSICLICLMLIPVVIINRANASQSITFIQTVSNALAGGVGPATLVLTMNFVNNNIPPNTALVLIFSDSNKKPLNQTGLPPNTLTFTSSNNLQYNIIISGPRKDYGQTGYGSWLYLVLISSIISPETIMLTDTGSSNGDMFISLSEYSGITNIGTTVYQGTTCNTGIPSSCTNTSIDINGLIVFGGVVSTANFTVTNGNIKDRRPYNNDNSFLNRYDLTIIDDPKLITGTNVANGLWGFVGIALDPSGISINGTPSTNGNSAWSTWNMSLTTTVSPTLIIVAGMIDNSWSGVCPDGTPWDCTVKSVTDSQSNTYSNVTIVNQDFGAGCQQFLYYTKWYGTGSLTINVVDTKPFSTQALGTFQAFAIVNFDTKTTFDSNVWDFKNYPVNTKIQNNFPTGGVPAYRYTGPPISKGEGNDIQWNLTTTSNPDKIGEMLLGLGTFGCSQLSGTPTARFGSTRVAPYTSGNLIFNTYTIIQAPYTKTTGVTWTGSFNANQETLIAINSNDPLIRTIIFNAAFVVGSLFIVVAICGSLNMIGLFGTPPRQMFRIDTEHNKPAFVTIVLFLFLGVILTVFGTLFP